MVTLSGELLSQAEILLRSGLHPSDIIEGYEKGLEKLKELLKNQVALTIEDVDSAETLEVISSVLAPKMPNHHTFFSKLIFDACRVITREESPRFNEDSLRVCRILGGGVEDSFIVKGFIINRGFETSGKELLENATVAVFRCPLTIDGGETKGNLLVKNAEELINFSKSEETFAEELVKGMVELGVNAVVVGGSISEICLHYMNKYGVIAVRIPSKFELMRVSRLLNAKAIPTVKAPVLD